MMLTQAGETGFIDWDHQPRKEAPRLRNISAFATHTPIFRKRPRSGSRKRQSPNKNMPSGKIGFDHCALCCMKSHSFNANDPSDAAMMKAEPFARRFSVCLAQYPSFRLLILGWASLTFISFPTLIAASDFRPTPKCAGCVPLRLLNPFGARAPRSYDEFLFGARLTPVLRRPSGRADEARH